MDKIFVFTASNQNVRRHYEKTIANPLPKLEFEKYFKEDELVKLHEFEIDEGYYVWGVPPGPFNTVNWESMQPGDHILFYQNKFYISYTKLLYKLDNLSFSKNVWSGDAVGEKCQHLFILEKPISFQNPVEVLKLSEYLRSSYRGFSSFTKEKITKITNEFGSVR